MAVLHLHHYGAPDGAPTLAIHGVTAHGERYRRLAQEAFPERRWLAPDLRGHGRSTWDGPWTVERHVADLVETPRCPRRRSRRGRRALLRRHDRPAPARHGAGARDAARAARSRHRAARARWTPRLTDETIEDPGWATPEEALAKRLDGRAPQSHADATEDVQRHLYQAPDGRYRMRFCRGAAIAGWSEMARVTVSVAHAQRPCLLVVAEQEEIVRPELRRLTRSATSATV